MSRDALNDGLIGKDDGVDTDLYKFESAIGTLVTYHFGDHSGDGSTATDRYLDLGTNAEDANKVVLRPKNNQATITKINNKELPFPIVVFVGAPYQLNYGKYVKTMEIYFDEDNTICEVQGYR